MGKLEITLPNEGVYNASIDCAIGELVLTVPDGIPVAIELDTAISSLHLPAGFTRDGDWVYSRGADATRNAMSIIHLSNPIGVVRILAE